MTAPTRPWRPVVRASVNDAWTEVALPDGADGPPGDPGPAGDSLDNADVLTYSGAAIKNGNHTNINFSSIKQLNPAQSLVIDPLPATGFTMRRDGMALISLMLGSAGGQAVSRSNGLNTLTLTGPGGNWAASIPTYSPHLDVASTRLSLVITVPVVTGDHFEVGFTKTTPQDANISIIATVIGLR